MGFWDSGWFHDAPEQAFDAAGKRAIVKHSCFGPLETRIWYQFKDGRYGRVIHFIEGLQEGEQYTDFISPSEMLNVIEAERVLSQKYDETDLAALFQAEKEKLRLSDNGPAD